MNSFGFTYWMIYFTTSTFVYLKSAISMAITSGNMIMKDVIIETFSSNHTFGRFLLTVNPYLGVPGSNKA